MARVVAAPTVPETFHFIVTTNPPRLKSVCRHDADLDDRMCDAEDLDATLEDMFALIGPGRCP
ncbi:hypothetical protein [Enhygromyxa salina]|uniref:hypothetical protein n=1 Tax=Enhygromyxa salina TaxID=215803 RepID=UPI000696FA8D|nr:hypothetical protein [Enhygromyxa salina]